MVCFTGRNVALPSIGRGPPAGAGHFPTTPFFCSNMLAVPSVDAGRRPRVNTDQARSQHFPQVGDHAVAWKPFEIPRDT
jgi:hypothetical protein